MKLAVIAALLTIGSGLAAQESDLTLSSTSELLVEVSYLTRLSSPVDVDLVTFGQVQSAYAILGKCEGKALEEINKEFALVAAMLTAYSGRIFVSEIPLSQWNRWQNRLCDLQGASMVKTLSILQQVQIDLIVKNAIGERTAILNQRMLKPDDLTNMIGDIALDFQSRMAE